MAHLPVSMRPEREIGGHSVLLALSELARMGIKRVGLVLRQ